MYFIICGSFVLYLNMDMYIVHCTIQECGNVDSTLEKQSPLLEGQLAESPFTFSYLAEILELRKW